ncbi:hypothetical protein [Pseudidiomarina gelatinasegens]|uniref:hypothetical protein n=1 Tax=Pseudidiomarina gelatinasegens TaxID=2487740 RepID=UPI003A97EFDA
MALFRSKRLAVQQKKVDEQTARISALSALLAEYKSRIALFEKALVDGTMEIENLSREGMERVLNEYEEKHYRALSDIERELDELGRK